MRWGKK